jgi:DNA (cytosine-5)-methyltransferase 1
MPDKDNLGAVLQPIGATEVSDSFVARNNQTTGFHTDVVATPIAYRWQNNRDGLQQDDAVAAMRASTGSSGFHEMNHPVVVAHALRGEGFDASEDGTGRGTPLVPVAPSLTATNDPSRSPQSSEVTQQVAAVYANTMTVRRLTARECERLQAFPDDYTLIPWRKKQAEDCPDGPRYRALGNSMAVNCMSWIGERIAKWEAEHER